MAEWILDRESKGTVNVGFIPEVRVESKLDLQGEVSHVCGKEM